MALHWLATLAITLAVLGSVGLAAIAWRLSQGPVDLAWLTQPAGGQRRTPMAARPD